jgi:hypothetical protein
MRTSSSAKLRHAARCTASAIRQLPPVSHRRPGGVRAMLPVDTGEPTSTFGLIRAIRFS